MNYLTNNFYYLGVNKLTKSLLFSPLPTFDSKFLPPFYVLLIKKREIGKTHSENDEEEYGKWGRRKEKVK